MRELVAGVGVGRTAAWDSPELRVKPKTPADWCQAIEGAAPAQVLADAQREFQDLLGRTES
ncbi:MAG: hypothetical protein DMD79_05065 [Candidatus Rokuibacteriota bacterium]|nr:MAG: hypothetical protein DMD79_05065 [Candidatus Rokubacteria bacterium]